MDKLLSIRNTAQTLAVSKDSVRRMIKRGDLEAVKVLRRTLVRSSSVERIIGKK